MALELGILYFHPKHDRSQRDYCAFYILEPDTEPDAAGNFAGDMTLVQALTRLSRDDWWIVDIHRRDDYAPPKVVCKEQVLLQREARMNAQADEPANS